MTDFSTFCHNIDSRSSLPPPCINRPYYLLTFNNSKNKTRVHRTRERRRAEVVLSLRWILFVITAPESNAPSCFFRRNNFRRTTTPACFRQLSRKIQKCWWMPPAPLIVPNNGRTDCFPLRPP
jgi:hypothetical protein